ncbi:MAG: hypothetical protein PVH92_10535, partial [Anaerolineales bacterium]
PGNSSKFRQIESPRPSEGYKQDDPFWIRGFIFERFLFGALSLFFIVLMVIFAPISADTEDKGLVVYLYSFLLLIQSIPLSVIYKSFSWLYIFREGIWIHNPFRRDRFLEWEEISSVRSSPWGSTLILSDSSGKIKARVYGSHRHSENFIGWFIQQRPDLWKPEEGLTFSTSSLFSLFLLLGILFELGMAFLLASMEDWEFWVVLGFAVLTFLTVWIMPMSIRLQKEYLLLRYPFRKRLVSAHDIVSLTAVYAPFGYIEMRLKEKRTITLLMFSLGINLLYAFLGTWHASWTRPNLQRKAWVPGGFRVPRQLQSLPLLSPPEPKEQ